MVTKDNYESNAVNNCLSVLIELMTILGAYREHIVLIGGWVPYFILGSKGKQHIGSMDIDIAIDDKNITNDSYMTILNLIQQRGYKKGKQPYTFFRKIETDNNIPQTVEIDLLAGEYGGTSKSHRTQRIQDIRARKARGCDLAFIESVQIKIRGKMPNESENEVTIKVASIVPFLVMKGMALWERLKEKDAYDIYFTILNYPGGLDEIIKGFKPYLSNKLIQEGLSKIKAKFVDLNMLGPNNVIIFLEIDEEEEKERIKRDAFERVNAFLDALNIQPYED